MTVYPFDFDDDETIIRIDDNISQLGGTAINQIRDAIFAMQQEYGINPAGSAGSVANRLNKSLDANGNIKASALTSIGLATLPIVDNQVASNAGIKETKLSLDFSTGDLKTLITTNKALIDSLVTFTSTTNGNLLTHIAGGTLLANGDPARHVASQIDLNVVPTDPRDTSYSWTGLLDKDGIQRAATQVAQALLLINNALVTHENLISNGEAHPAAAISVDTDPFTEIPVTATTVQSALEAIDDSDRLTMGVHRASMHSNGVMKEVRSESLVLPDGYSQNIVPPTPVSAFLVKSPANTPIDNNVTGDDVVVFNPNNSGFIFDGYFAAVQPGDYLRINYGDGFEALYMIESKRFQPDTEWVVRLNGVNISSTDGYDGYARIDRRLYDNNTAGVLACAAANNDIDSSIRGSVVVGNPRAANALGIGFEPNQLDADHYKLYLHLYPSGNPVDKVIELPAIDVTGNAGATPGQYTLERVVAATNDGLRAAGYNYRFLAYGHNGEFGIMLTDTINNAGFSIVSGILSGATLGIGSFTENVVGDANDGLDPLGFGSSRAGIASPKFTPTFSSELGAANLPTIVIPPLKNRFYVADGTRLDTFADTYLANEDGYWDANLTARTPVGTTTVEVTYIVELGLEAAGLAPGKTITVAPAVDFDNSLYRDVDYGRFIIKDVTFPKPCPPGSDGQTIITVINGIHAAAAPVTTSSSPTVPVRLYFGEDSVGFNELNIINNVQPGVDYLRYHEVYIDKNGNTFSHERARLPEQDESSELLETNSNWTIKNVSPKLLGWRDSSTSSSFRRYVRFYVLDYDTISGEFDGYIGRRVSGSPNVTDTGPVVRARKNQTTRFYDGSNIDFVELEFFDDDVSPGTDIMLTSSPRYVDIELFPSLALDDELFLLASCEVEDNVVQCVTDRREFGNTSEQNFTESAKNFIEAGERYLHANGVIRGLGFRGTDSSNDGVLLFDGGLAVVNGKFIAINSQSVEIPQISEDGVSLPDQVDWAICINEHGLYEPVIITPDKIQFFALLGGAGTSYYVPSVTFNELITKRKDLTPVAFATVTIASITINQVLDARRFVTDETASIPFSWVPVLDDDSSFSRLEEVIGHFKSFEAVRTWVNNYGAINNTIIVRGQHTFASTLDLSLLEQGVKFVGDGYDVEWLLRGNAGVTLGSNVSMEGIKFIYSPDSPTTTGGDFVNATNGEGALTSTSGNLVNVSITNCKFEIAESLHPPFINIAGASGELLENIVIDNNYFWDDPDSLASEEDLTGAIVIACTSAGGSTPAVASNVRITNNRCNLSQGIYVTSWDYTDPGLSCIDVLVEGNACGNIGYLTTSEPNDDVIYPGRNSSLGIAHAPNLTIRGNTCRLIQTCIATGVATLDATTYGCGHVTITENSANWIFTENRNDSGIDGYSSCNVSNNKLQAFDDTYVTQFNSAMGLVNAAIFTNGTSDSTDTAVVHGNNICGGTLSGSTYTYGYGIYARSGGPVTDNTIRDFTTSGITFAFGADGYTVCTGNIIDRKNISISSYIAYGAGSGLIVNNVFSSPTIDGSSTATLSNVGGGSFVAEKNKNQTVEVNVSASSIGTWSLEKFNDGFAYILNPSNYSSSIYRSTFGATALLYAQADADASERMIFQWSVPLSAIIPQGTRVIGVSVDIANIGAISVPPGYGVSLALREFDGVPVDSVADSFDNTDHTVTLSSLTQTWTAENNELVFTADGDQAITFRGFVYQFIVTCRW